jgi:CHASE3 domain sensor protein
MENEKSIEELERESAEIRLEINKTMEKSMKDMEKTDRFFKFIQMVLIVILLVAICTVINSIRVDNELLETYDSCVDINGERYCRVED